MRLRNPLPAKFALVLRTHHGRLSTWARHMQKWSILCDYPRPPCQNAEQEKTVTRGEAASFAGILKRYHLEIAPNLAKHVGNCRLPLIKCHSCEPASPVMCDCPKTT